MAAFRLTVGSSLARQVGRVEGVLLVRMRDGVAYTAQELMRLCEDSGVTYTLAEYGAIAQARIADGVIEQVD